jgi:antitoxin CptB
MDPRRSKLKYRAWHRGFREADLILGAFADARVPGMTPEELDGFEALLELPDHDLYAWILGKAAPPADLDASALGLLGQMQASAGLAT